MGSPRGTGALLKRRQPLNAATEIAGELRKAIVNGALVAGNRLIETEIAEQMAVSRGPVREALRILHEEQLIEMRPNRGAVVSGVGADDVLEVYALRGAIGLIAIRNLIGQHRFSEEGRRTVQARIEDVRGTELARLRSMPDAPSADLIAQEFRIQSAVVRAASLPRVYRRFDQLTAEVQSLVSALEIEYRDFEKTVRKYASLLAAIQEGDAEGSEAIWRDHISLSSQELLAMLPDGKETFRERPWMITLY